MISGFGSNMEFLLRDLSRNNHPGEARIVISDNPEALGLIKAKRLGIPTSTITPKITHRRREYFESKLLTLLKFNEIETICLAGFMRILSPKFLAEYSGHILNIHPSILPSLKGLNTHERVLKKRLPVHGATVHKVTKDLDAGTILGQTTIRIQKDDTPQSLSNRLKPKEHQLYAETLRNFLSGNSDIIQKYEEAGASA